MNINDINLTAMTPEELRALNSRVVARLNELHARKRADAGAAFGVGDHVTFKDKRGFTIRGIIEKTNRVTAVVSTEIPEGKPWMGKKWRVDYSFLRKADATPTLKMQVKEN